MKIIIQSVSILFLMFTIFNFSYAQTNQDAFEYFKVVTKSTNSLKSSTWIYLRTLAKSKNPKRIEKQRLKLLANIKEAQKEIEAKELVNEDASIKEALVQYLDLKYKILEEDYAEIVDMEEIAEQSYDAMEAYLMAQDAASKKLEEAFESYVIVEKEYCKKNNIQLLEAEDALSKKIEKAAAALSYYNELFLIYFKSNIEENYIIEALDRNDINALQQSTNSLQVFSEEGIESVKNTEAFNGDSKLKYVTNKLLKYYQDASTKSYPKLVDFFLLKDDYEKANKNFEKIKPKKRTQKDVDTFNAIVKKFNKSLNEFNDINGRLNQKRQKLFDEWDKTTATFFWKARRLTKSMDRNRLFTPFL